MTNNTDKTETSDSSTADPPLWKHKPHQRRLPVPQKSHSFAPRRGKPISLTSTSIAGSRKTTTTPHKKIFNIRHGSPLPTCANSPHFREHIMVSWGSTTAESERDSVSERVVFSSLHVPLLAVNNCEAPLYSTSTRVSEWKATGVHWRISCGD